MLSTRRIPPLAHRWPFVILLLLLLLATLLRLWKLDVLPPGLFYDEAFNGLDARRLLTGDELPLYFPANNGREPLYFYLQAISVFLFGANAFALRLVSALIGIATVAAIYYLAKTVFAPSTTQENIGQESPEKTAAGTDDASHKAMQILYWVALIAAAGIAVSFWHVSLSRLAFRAILLPLISALAFSAFWIGWRDGNRRAWIWAGVALAVAAYTYTAARLLPLVLVTFVLVEVMIDWLHLRATPRRLAEIYKPRLRGLLLMTGTALLFVLPLAWSFVTHPWLLSGRAEQVSIFTIAQEDMPGTVLQRFGYNVQVTLRSFYNTGDQNLRHNLPGRSVNDAVLAILFSLGLLAAAQGISNTARYRFLLIWLAVMLTPTIFSNLAPHALRSIGALPPLALLYGAGAGWVLQRISQSRTRHRAGTGLLLLVVLGSGSLTAYDYFVRWAGQAQLGAHFDLERYLAAQTVDEWLNNDEKTSLLLSQALYQTPQMQFMVGDLPRQDLFDAASLPGEDLVLNIVASPDTVGNGQATFLLHKHAGSAAASWREPRVADLAVAAATAQVIRWPLMQAQWPVLLQSRLSKESQTLPEPRQIDHSLSVTFENGMKLVGYEVTETTIPWRTERGFRLVTFWQRGADTDPTELEANAFYAFVHLYQDGVLSQSNTPLGNLFPVYLWATDEVVESWHYLQIPPKAKQGKAYFEVGLYDAGSEGEKRIGIVDGFGLVSASQADFGAVMIDADPPQASLDGLCTINAQFGNQIRLTGSNFSITSSQSASSSQSSQLEIVFGWEALDRPHTDYTMFVHLLNQSGEIIGQNDQPPGGLENPTSRWVPTETVRSKLSIPLPQNLEDAAMLRVGLYEPVSGKQLPITAIQPSSQFVTSDTFVLLPVNNRQSGEQCP